MKIAHEEVWDMAPAMASLIGVQCGRVQELTAHAPVEKRVFAKTTSKHANTRQNTHVFCGTSRQCAASSWAVTKARYGQ